MKTAVLNKGKEDKYLNQYPLIEEEDIYRHDRLEEGDLIQLLTSKKSFIGVGYVGRQHKGLGWILSYEKDDEINQSFFEQLFEQALETRQYYYQIEGTNAFRLFNGEGDGIGGLTIDSYDGHLLIQWYSIGIYQFRDSILEAIKQVFPFRSIFEKTRFKHQSIKGGWVEGEKPEFPIVIEENFTFYNVHLDDGPMTGIFLDQKEARKKLRDYYSEDRKVLNLFSYTGAFSVISATGGAKTTSVDLANRSRPMTEENFGLNGIDPKSQNIFVMDTFDFYKYAERHGLTFDTIVIDPPSFARNKKKTFSVTKNYPQLIEGALTLLNAKGSLILSTNHSAYSLKAFKNMVKKTLDYEGISYQIDEVMGLPKDFKTHPHYKPSKYLKLIFVTIQ
ncbi:class I SAM-dependent rRNA methyltransferase [Staphylococcus coagulans]|uniref:class I SAM-dependent rRNA methyltransferase n=1 Tax=Staphylococcus coagulans TaxID=74706 RepID=UPI001BE50EC6|nr:class I SAM-dependent rRNA methyltransferase [Staphylococcus coagulans]MBT2813557.1 class I SAM-dependent rRNA methyltransferase [Staphylococcus coagulans]MBT2815820.1 class I SAM-dependent rRNA methyltransferase [Staphylococcus coagulans]MBT2836791.1 class I SAM-dependent rRNA methyltransferase [Staphylococcus coagulans]MBT2841319.1 class I SAM-dependent rRNA methyltransferase [Staphylococcus coagulans]MBT2847782.1 class I SAM-dependent rRNA methyltransferase [Staphylococcus coagulans]